MKARLLLLLFSPLLFAGCTQEKQSGSIPTVDVTASYPEKTITLQDFADVEYIPLETSDEFLTQGSSLVVSDNYILVTNRANDGNLYLFDRSGKGIRVINHKGNGPGEYTAYGNILIDEEHDEIFINDLMQFKIFIYDMEGNFKRSFSYDKETNLFHILSYDQNSFIYWNSAHQFDKSKIDAPQFYICSKQDGSVIKELSFPYEKRVSTMEQYSDASNNTWVSFIRCYNVNCFHNQMILFEPSCDTIYGYSSAGVEPLFVRTPSIQSMKDELFLLPGIFTDDYAFFRIKSKEQGNIDKDLAYDHNKQEFFFFALYNADWKDEFVDPFRENSNPSIYFAQCLYPDALFEANKQGKLSGKLKELVDTMDVEDNPVVMIVKPKK